MPDKFSARESGILFLKSSLSNADFDFTTLYEEVKKITTHEGYQNIPHTPVYTGFDWAGQPFSESGRTTYTSELRTLSLPLDELVSPDLREIIEVMIKQAETAKIFDKFQDLRSKVTPDDPKTLRAYQDFLEEAEYKALKLDDLQKYNPLSYNEIVMKAGQGILSKKEATIPDMISGVVLLKDIKEFFGVDVVDAGTAEEKRALLKDAIATNLKGDVKSGPKLEGNLGKLFTEARKQIHKLDQLRSNVQEHGLSIDNNEVDQKISKIVNVQTDVIYNHIADCWRVSP